MIKSYPNVIMITVAKTAEFQDTRTKQSDYMNVKPDQNYINAIEFIRLILFIYFWFTYVFHRLRFINVFHLILWYFLKHLNELYWFKW
ncbi:MAG: hypothetical protein Ta2E_02040 [Mycoplasmoidaceae bacterium]|nr:MAG: hypothetical protein Ta2E_02040 [Mycoplasmoidaceae bacterium]